MRFCDLLEDLSRVANSGRAEEPSPRTVDLRLILGIVKTMNRSLVLQEVLEAVLDGAIGVAGAERGFVLLATPEDGPTSTSMNLKCVLGRDRAGHTLDNASELISRSIVDDVFAGNESVFIESAQRHPHYDLRQSIIDLGLQTILCAPLFVHDERIGVIYVDSRSIQPFEEEEVIDTFEILAGQAAIAIRNAQLYEKLDKLLHDLEVANEHRIKSERLAIKGEMAAEIGHELKNLVSTLTLGLSVVARSFGRHPEDEIKSRVYKVLAMGKQIQRFAEGLTEKSSLLTKKRVGDVNREIRELLHFVESLSKYRRSTFGTDLDPNIPRFSFDAQQIQQVLLNLLSNAVEARPENAIHVRSRFDPGKQRVILIVQDDGPGISKEVREKLFTEKITTKVNGHGYGLPICKKMIEQHSGSLEVESPPSGGTTFTIDLPVVPS